MRPAERGLSVIEALIMLALLALAAAIAMAPLGAGLRDDMRLAQDSVAGSQGMAGEDAFRRLIESAVPGADGALLTGDATTLVLFAYVERPTVCNAGPGFARIAFSIVDGDALQCTDGDRTVILNRWPGARAQFAYGDGRGVWRTRASEIDAATRLVRLTADGAEGLAWVVAATRLPPAGPSDTYRRPDGGGDLDR